MATLNVQTVVRRAVLDTFIHFLINLRHFIQLAQHLADPDHIFQ